MDGNDRIRQAAAAAESRAWPNRQPIPNLMPAAPSLPESLVPERLQPWLCDMADRTQIPLEFVAAPAVVALSSLIGRRLGIYPKERDDWLVVPNLWGAIIGRPGVLKSPAIAEAVRPLRRLAQSATEEHRTEVANAEADSQIIKMRVAALDVNGKKAAKDGNEQELLNIQSDLAALNLEAQDAVVYERRYVVNDGTVEKIGELLNQNPRGLLLCRDELSGWLKSMDKSGREGDREFYLEAWNGDGRFTYDRIGRGTLHIDALTLSVLGTIQPGKLKSYIDGAMAGGYGDDGLLQRFQVIVWPEQTENWRNVDRWPDTAAKNTAFEIYRNIDRLALTPPDDGSIPALRFGPEAQQLFNEWRAGHEVRLRSDEMEQTPAFESHLAKYRSLMPSLALVFQVIEMVSGGASEVSLSAAQNAADWCDFLESHAVKLYAAEVHPERAAAHKLADKIKSGAIGHGSTVRDIYRPQWSGLTSPENVWSGIKILEGSNWVRIGEKTTNGRPTEVIEIHPEFRRNAA